MDLNHLYFEHQIALMRIASATDAQLRTGHQVAAKAIARRIAQFQQGKGASNWCLQGACA